MKLKTAFLAFLALCTTLLSAQEKAQSSLGVQIGAGYIMKQDLILSPMIHKQFSLYKVRLEYKRSGKVEQQIDVQFSAYSTSINDQFQYFWHDPDELEVSGKHSFNLLYINYKLGKKLVDREKFDLSAGLRLRSRLNASTYTYGIYWLGHFAYYFAHGVDASVDMNYSLSEKHAVNMGVALPFFSMVSRSPYLVQNAQYYYDNIKNSSVAALFKYIGRSKPQSWGSSQIVDVNLGYSHTISKKLDLDLSYLFSMDLNKAPKKLTQFENSILAGLTYKF